jgi:hypothetical protein
MQRDDFTSEEADNLINYMRLRVDHGDDPDEVLFDCRLEPDYLEDLLGF